MIRTCQPTASFKSQTDTVEEFSIKSGRMLHLKLREERRPVCCYHTDNPQEFCEAIKQLQLIKDRFCKESDLLSKNIVKWAGDCRYVSLGTSFVDSDSLSSIQPAIRQGIDALAREVLVDSLTETPLENPVKDGIWTWDAAVVKDFCSEGSGISPLTSLPFSDPMEVHEFAKEMLYWKKCLICPIPPCQDLIPSQLTIADVEDPRVALIALLRTANSVSRAAVYSIIANTKRTVADNEERNERFLSKATEMSKEVEENMQRKLVFVLAQKEKELESYDVSVNLRFKKMEEIHQQEKRVLEAKISQLSQRVNSLESQHTQSLSMISSYRIEISELESKYRAREEEIRRSSHSSGSSGSSGGGLVFGTIFGGFILCILL